MNLNSHKHKAIAVILCMFMLTGCEKAKQEMGMTRHSPDEFAVVTRAPLEMPPEYALRPPKPGAPRPQETAPVVQAKQTVFGKNTNKSIAPGSGEDLLLQKTGGDKVSPEIREIVDHETEALTPKEKPVAERILGITGFGKDDEPPASVVDPEAEAQRLKKNSEEGKPVTEGQTPVVEE
jgi:hypothetical protein